MRNKLKDDRIYCVVGEDFTGRVFMYMEKHCIPSLSAFCRMARVNATYMHSCFYRLNEKSETNIKRAVFNKIEKRLKTTPRSVPAPIYSKNKDTSNIRRYYKQGFTREQLAKKFGVSGNEVSKALRDQPTPTGQQYDAPNEQEQA